MEYNIEIKEDGRRVFTVDVGDTPPEKIKEALEQIRLEVRLRNQSSNEFTDISTEESRMYTFPGGDIVHISKPLHLSVSPSGHRILDSDGVSHYIPKGWIHLKWKAKEGQPHFVK